MKIIETSVVMRLFLILSISLGIHSAMASTQNSSDIIFNQFVAGLKESKAFQLDFHQAINNLSLEQSIERRGTVMFSLPDVFRWDYSTEPKNVIASNGRILVLLLPDEELIMADLLESQSAFWSPVTALLTDESLKVNFEMKYENIQSNHRFSLIPKAKETTFRSLLLEFQENSKTGDFKLTIFDLAGNENLLMFSNYSKIDPESIVLPTLPRDFDVVDFNGQPISKKILTENIKIGDSL